MPEVRGHSGGYIKITDARRVRVRGSLYFDGDHEAGCLQGCPGPSYAKPTSVWEIHPVYSITAAPAEQTNYLLASTGPGSLKARATLRALDEDAGVTETVHRRGIRVTPAGGAARRSATTESADAR